MAQRQPQSSKFPVFLMLRLQGFHRQHTGLFREAMRPDQCLWLLGREVDF